MSDKLIKKTSFSKELVSQSIIGSFTRLSPFYMIKNPVMFLVWIGSVVTTIIVIKNFLYANNSGEPLWFDIAICFWLWFTVIFANFAEALAEGRGKAHASSLKSIRTQIIARKLNNDGSETPTPADDLRRGDIVVVAAGEMIPCDGEVIIGIAAVDESAITGESAPVIRESGGDRSSVTGGTKVISDQMTIRITSDPGSSYLDHMIALVQGASRQKTPNELALQTLLMGLTAIFIVVCITLMGFGNYLGVHIPITVIIALLVCLVPTTIGGLVSAIGIAGMERLLCKNVLAMSGRAVEAAGDVDVLLLDKTGTITLGNRMASELIPVRGVDVRELAEAAELSSLADDTAEGRSIVKFVADNYSSFYPIPKDIKAEFIPFMAETRMSGCDFEGRIVRKGAVDTIVNYVTKNGGTVPEEFLEAAQKLGQLGATPLGVVEGNRILGIIHLKDIVKPGMKQRFDRFRAMGIKTVMITGDNPFTAGAIAKEAGVDEFLAEATPEKKMHLIREHQLNGHLVAMTGDGTNDAPALAQADVGVAMNSGTPAAKEAANMIDLDSDPTKLLEVVEIGKQLLMTRGCLTTFSTANDIAKYFAILPAIFLAAFPVLAPLNIMGLTSNYSAILSAVIFNALIIIFLVPLALKGVAYRPLGAAALLKRSLLIYGLGGIITPFIGIKLIDMFLNLVGLV